MKEKKKTLGRVKEKDIAYWRVKAIDIFAKLPYETLCRIGNTSDYYTWNEEYGEKPEGWDDMSSRERCCVFFTLRDVIRDHVGEKALLRHFYKTQFGYTDQQFNDWWDSKCHYLGG